MLHARKLHQAGDGLAYVGLLRHKYARPSCTVSKGKTAGHDMEDSATAHQEGS